MATRIERVEVRKRGFFGMVFWLVFLAFNALMALWMFAGIKGASDQYQATTDAASHAGTAIGGTVALGILLWIWLFGAIILGLLVLLSRGKKVTIERTIEG
ncbi:hypothetical protein NP945_10705 [Mesorhizobium sp. LMG17149]|uniref:hypothetical protein n=1 Tax=Mesorhizobium sp. LMG17149 TaxID=2968497 RepID=UPI002118D776|nr:hypothetical protein [Mesorhizobium sp. LMG17149]MCQ8872289.1 hypothetical protein [Mesorhizobium sp. LMG17149]